MHTRHHDAIFACAKAFTFWSPDTLYISTSASPNSAFAFSLVSPGTSFSFQRRRPLLTLWSVFTFASPGITFSLRRVLRFTSVFTIHFGSAKAAGAIRSPLYRIIFFSLRVVAAAFRGWRQMWRGRSVRFCVSAATRKGVLFFLRRPRKG